MKIQIALCLCVIICSTYSFEFGVVECVKDVVQTYFTSGETLVISYNGNEEGNSSTPQPYDWGLIIKVFFETYMSTVLIINARHGTMFQHRKFGTQGFYVLMSEMVNHRDIIYDMEYQSFRLKSSKEWNPRAKFLVLLLKMQNISVEEHQRKLAQDVFTVLWKWKVMDVVLLLPSESKDLSSQEESTSLLNAFTWFPYSPAGNCGNVNNVALVNKWIMEKSRKQRFQFDIPLFPNKIPNNFGGCPLRITCFQYEPFIMGMVTREDGTVDYRSGIEVELVNVIANVVNMSILFQLPSPGNFHWGADLGNGAWAGLPGEVLNDTTDLVIENFWYRCHFINDLECLIPHLEDAARWFVPCAKPYPQWMSITRVFAASLWIGFLLSFIVVSLVMSQMVRISNRFSPPHLQENEYSGVTSCLLNFWAVILEESATNNPPRSFPLRTVFLTWVLGCWAINNVYQTFLTSYLVDPGLKSQISSEDELLNSGIIAAIFTEIGELIPVLYTKRYSKRFDCVDYNKCMDRVASSGDMALVFSTLQLEFIIASRYTDGDGKPLICYFDEVITSQMIVVIVKKGFLAAPQFNKIIRSCLQAGLVSYWKRNLEYLATLKSAKEFNLPPGDYVKLTTEHLQSAFYFLLLGYILSTFIFICELILHRIKFSRQRRQNKRNRP